MTSNQFGQFKFGELFIKGIIRPLSITRSQSGGYTMQIHDFFGPMSSGSVAYPKPWEQEKRLSFMLASEDLTLDLAGTYLLRSCFGLIVTETLITDSNIGDAPLLWHEGLLLARAGQNDAEERFSGLGTFLVRGDGALKLRYSPPLLVTNDVAQELINALERNQSFVHGGLEEVASERTVQDRLREGNEVVRNFMLDRGLPLDQPFPEAQVVKLV
ncbi:hypothetical protein GGR51DRAFT_563752 [Nemania sp. FL0031]|nr:hypothetical protein GGR51DRAFT_563752 [Nemania sp. FL0031]